MSLTYCECSCLPGYVGPAFNAYENVTSMGGTRNPHFHALCHLCGFEFLMPVFDSALCLGLRESAT